MLQINNNRGSRSQHQHEYLLQHLVTHQASGYGIPSPIPNCYKLDDERTATLTVQSIHNEPPEHYQPRKRNSALQWQLKDTSWRTGARCASVLAIISFLLNLGATIWASIHRVGSASPIYDIFEGDCHRANRVNFGFHVAINTLSTLLLSGSNYCMQCLSAPTRAEVDAAHGEKTWLDIGVMSLRNSKYRLRHPKRTSGLTKVYIWLLLGMSSVPLHVLYNATVFSSIATHDYDIVVVSQAFAEGQPIDDHGSQDWWSGSSIDVAVIQSEMSTYEVLNNRMCIDLYARDFITQHSTVIIVASDTGVNSTVVAGASVSLQNALKNDPIDYWICRADPQSKFYEDEQKERMHSVDISRMNDCTAFAPRLDATRWAPFDATVSHCLSKRVEEHCKVHFHIPIMIEVMLCNLAKLGGMLFVVFRCRDTPLVTLGDALESFLDRADNSTIHCCLGDKKDFGQAQDWHALSVRPKEWRPKRYRWATAASETQWWVCIAIFIVAIITTSTFWSATGTQFWHHRIGEMRSEFLISSWSISTATQAVLLANLPQVFLSCNYLIMSNLLTTMLLNLEWDRFGSQRKPLRVSTPKNGQRSTYFLQLPYRYSLPLTAMSGLLHWLISQCIFPVMLDEIDQRGDLIRFAVATCGYSPAAIFTLCICLTVLVLVVVTLGQRHYSGRMPMIGSCSAAISAACHLTEHELGVTQLPLLWGVKPGEEAGDNGDTAGHAGYSSELVNTPLPGHLYA